MTHAKRVCGGRGAFVVFEKAGAHSFTSFISTMILWLSQQSLPAVSLPFTGPSGDYSRTLTCEHVLDRALKIRENAASQSHLPIAQKSIRIAVVPQSYVVSDFAKSKGS